MDWVAGQRAFGSIAAIASAELTLRTPGGVWRRRFGGDPTVVGRTLLLDGSPYEVIGVMPSGFRYPVGALEPTQVWEAVPAPETYLPLSQGVGVYGLMAYAVLQRTHEIGIRMALGASRATVTRMVYGHAGRLVALGMSVGGAGAWYLSGSVRSFLYGIEASDVQSFVAAVATLSLTALAACVVPARRAATVDPVVALRDE